MKDRTNDLLRANTDIITLIRLVSEIGWNSLREQSIHRIFYLFKVLYLFVYPNDFDGDMNIYHFSANLSGPYSELINRSIINLQTKEYLVEDSSGNIIFAQVPSDIGVNEKMISWYKTIIYIIGLYGENKVYGFTINDPLYKEAIETNSQEELNTTLENKTIKVLNSFKKAFEDSLTNVSQINKEEYLELYFEYIFSKIIKREE